MASKVKLLIECTEQTYEECKRIQGLSETAYVIANGTPITDDYISRNAVIRMFNTMDRYRADVLMLQDTDEEFPKNEVFIVDDCYELLDQIKTIGEEGKR